MNWYDEAMFEMDDRELKSSMNAKAMTESRHGDLVRAFLIDLEREYSPAHRAALQATWALDVPPRSVVELARDMDVPARSVRRLIGDSVVYARKWFGSEGIAHANHARPLKKAA